MFTTANVTGSATTISAADDIINTYFTGLSRSSISQACQNYLHFIQCLTVYLPCPGTAWCGSMSPTELTTALNNACGCTGTSCTFPVPTLINYYQGSSSGGRVNNDMLTCQDVSVGKECWYNYKQHLCAYIPLFVLPFDNIAYLHGLLSVTVVQPDINRHNGTMHVCTRTYPLHSEVIYKVTYIPSIIASHGVMHIVYLCTHQEVCCCMHFKFCGIYILWIFHIHGYHVLKLLMLPIVSCVSIDV